MTIYSLDYSFPNLEPVCSFMSGSNCCFLTCIQISQEAGQVVWYSHLFQNFPQFLQARVQQYMNRELLDVEAGFRKGRGTRDEIANIRWIIEKARDFQKNIYFCFIDYAKAFDCVDHNKLENSSRDGNSIPSDLSLEKPVCRSKRNN